MTTDFKIVPADSKADDGLPTIEGVRGAHFPIPEGTRERIEFLCQVFDPTRDASIYMAARDYKIADDYLAELIEETRPRVLQSVKAGAVAYAMGKAAREAGLVNTDDEQADLVWETLEPLREAGPDERTEDIEAWRKRYQEGEGHLDRVQGDDFDSRFSELVQTAEEVAAGITFMQKAVLRAEV